MSVPDWPIAAAPDAREHQFTDIPTVCGRMLPWFWWTKPAADELRAGSTMFRSRCELTGDVPDRDDLLREVVHELFAAGLDLHTALGLLSGHIDLARDRLHAVISRLDDSIKTIHQARAQASETKPSDWAVADTLAELATGRTHSTGLPAWLNTLTRRCVELANADAAGLVLVDGRAKHHLAAAHPDTAIVQPLCEPEEGPWHEAYRTGRPVTVPDLTTAGNLWPHFTTRARTAGFRFVHTLPLRSGDAPLGALTLFSATAHTPATDTSAAAQGLADLAALAVLHDRTQRQREQLAEGLQEAMASQAIIEQAKGVLAERHTITVPDAMIMLTAHARLHDKSVLDIARKVVSGDLDLSRATRQT